jgi:hypothetical protein
VSEPIILRQRSGPIITIIVWVFIAFLLGDALFRGAWDTVGRFGPPLLLVGWLAFIVLWRPALIVGRDQVDVREILRTTTVPFSRIHDIRLTAIVTIEAASTDGTTNTIRPWNAPGMPRRKIDSGLTGGTLPKALPNHPSYELHQRWEQAQINSQAEGSGSADANEQGPAADIDTHWNLGVIGVTIVLVLLVVAGLI